MSKGAIFNYVAASALALAPVTLTAPPAFGGGGGGMTGGATEVTQLANNVQLGIQSVQEEMTYVQTQINTYYSMLQHLPMTIADSMGLGGILNTYNTLTNTYSSLQRLAGSLDNMKNLSALRMNSFASTGLDWNSYVRREQSVASSTRSQYGILTQMEAQALQDVQSNFDQVKKFESQIDSTMGVHSSAQLMNGQMNSLLSMTNQILQFQLTQGYVASAAKQGEALKQERSESAASAFVTKYYSDLKD